MAKISAGVLLFRRRPAGVEVLLVHPGGPFWAKKDQGAWSIPKGLANEGEDWLAAAKREFLEETGAPADGEFVELGAFKQPGGKTVVAFACEGDFDPASLDEQHVFDRVAAAFRPHGGVPRGRQSRLVFDRRSDGEGDTRPEADHRRPGRKARRQGA